MLMLFMLKFMFTPSFLLVVVVAKNVVIVVAMVVIYDPEVVIS
jgi:hypothetical protein